MIESLEEHGVLPTDLVPALMTTHTVANPEYDPEARRRQEHQTSCLPDDDETLSISDRTLVNEPVPTTSKPAGKPDSTTPTHSRSSSLNQSPNHSTSPKNPAGAPATHQTTAKVLADTSTSAIPGVSTSLSSADQNVTLDIRWTVLCDLFLVLIADSVYDARSRVLLENVANKLGLGWIDVVKFESRVTEALEIQEDVETLEQQGAIDGQQKALKRKRYMMLGLATIGLRYFLIHAHFPPFLNIHFHRGWSGHWFIGWFTCPSHWGWSRCRSYNNRGIGFSGFPHWGGWDSGYHHWWSSHRIRHSCPRDG